MPYNTRRKSLSLPSLGIHLPNASRSHRSPSASKGSSSSVSDEQVPPPKKVKRSHDAHSAASSPSTHDSKLSQSHPKLARAAYERTPPPSPGDVAAIPKIDTDGIHDDVVVDAIHQLEKTGNKPHLVRELAAVLMNINETVANSANPAALLSSRLSSYMKRSWTALSPCPMGKELINVHPRKVFYYLTTYPHQPLPENLDEMVAVDVKQMTPSLSSGSVAQDDDDEEEAMARERSRLSPSPEIDLSAPEFEEEQHDLEGRDPGSCDTSTPGFSDQRAHRLSHNHRAASPPLEGDEREFTQTASSVRERASSEKASRQGSLDVASASPSNESQAQAQSFPVSPMDEDPMTSMTEKDEYFSHGASHDQDNDMEDETVAALFGTSPSPSLASMSSGTTVSSEASSTADGLQSLKQNIMDSPRGATPSSVVDGDAVPSSLKRPFDLVETGFSVKPDMEPKQLRNFDFDFDMVMDSWNDLRSPETVEVDELDEMFGDI
ncbi:hypothetical protein PISL3812_09551 [Talaromyces islandicus]|uniref:GDS1 winged helix domain-containing protein n=1 Tax=Talaromyces islandicus TaxID=28573 RepID=A0A0U1MBX1_TALIS|nr:hypothetical protein PISL3812_09551 [Talaromyces islandicus]